MWRSFFFAVGVMLIIFGFECLVADRFEISSSARIPKAVTKLFDDGESQKPGFGRFNGSDGGGSQFGPSRFNSPFDNNQSLADANYYGGVSSASLRQPAKRPFSLAGFGSNRSRNGDQPSPQAILVQGKDSRIVYTKDWMPWSLLAAGTLVVLYTNSTTSRENSND